MPKKRRARPRQRPIVRPAAATTAVASREERPLSGAPIRPRFSRPGTIGRATGQPSQTLLKAATLEYGFVMKDIRRIGLVAGGAIALLAVATVAANALLK